MTQWLMNWFPVNIVEVAMSPATELKAVIPAFVVKNANVFLKPNISIARMNPESKSRL
jgi:hypothetical protein